MPMCTTGAGPAAALLGSSGPTVLLDANWATDTIVDDGLVPIADGNPVDVWTMATGGDFNYTTAAVAGASARPIWVAASGIHTAGNNAALTTASPVVIPADTDCVIYVKANLALEMELKALGNSAAVDVRLLVQAGDGVAEHLVTLFLNGTNYVSATMTAQTAAGVYLLRFTRTSGVWSFACTGVASASMAATGTVTGSLAFNTLLAFSSTGSGLDDFSGSGIYLQKLKIWSGTSDPDTTFETANGGTL